MTRSRRPRPRGQCQYDLSPKTSPETFAAAAAVLAERGWRDGETFRMRPSALGPHELLIAPIVGGNDMAPGSGMYEWQEGQGMEWFNAARRLARDLAKEGWTSHGATNRGTYFQRPARPGLDHTPYSGDVATAPPGAPVRLLAIAAEVGITDAALDAAVCAAAHEVAADSYNSGAYPEVSDDRAHRAVHADADVIASKINMEGRSAQLAYLYEGCASEAAFRSLLHELCD
ncbi:hypothetical protein HUT19_41140 [Streptomyces sp. NA02950]|uniref:hypothetical protein n=1 Tax=Streptomyces sp. NA02950 TaxID=2742137 RepID=UPI0015923723|nr:hypothetical protein [Streptomyces sp. NA02950]QKV90379.1 hypothetical protein HUT19_00080 [Streptomyces sp. NA02950]QKV97288.1 hypothetical protein HUT19_41140 [Streptomyces sp. NA02950]